MSNCGCNNTGGEPETSEKEMLLIKATGKSASQCGDPNSIESPAAQCQKNDSTYDTLLANFAFPDEDAVPVLVCDGSLYSVGQWIQFVDSEAKVNIVSINANELTVKGICSNGVAVLGNPTAGTIIRKNEAIVVVDSPDCLTDEEKTQKLQDDLSSVEELCMPNLQEESSTTAEQQLVGWTQEDDGNAGFTHCLKRIVGNFFKNGIPFLTRLTTLNYDASEHRFLIINSATGQVYKSAVEVGLPSSQYAWAPSFATLATLGTDESDIDSWIRIDDGDSRNFALNFNISSINDLDIDRDFYALLKINIGCAQTGNFRSSATLKVNGVTEGVCYNNYASYGTQSITVVVPIDKDDLSATLDLETTSNVNAKFFLEAKIQGVYF